ncbi:RimJ/RimL family protein N-acetyltransferase [Chitinivorax tropicus]|uniref:RimJ/RimL family protein N-acetyltransferase n=1 Tax=Chitinivorax tropicus TaxID=714531 RepID=A0A840MJ98_9PROT|nr:RimJ/RimL family protein N-acetyltransferase [Chitinivorax tropicus]
MQALLSGLPVDVQFDVVVGALCEDAHALQQLALIQPRVRCHIATTQMATLMTKATIFVGAGGATTWERVCLRLPSIIVAVAPNQEAFNEELAMQGAQCYLGPVHMLDLPTIVSSSALLLGNSAWRQSMKRQLASKQVDGLGAQRVASAMLTFNHAAAIQLRPACMDDAVDLHTWRNHPTVRQFAGDDQEIPFATHIRWLNTALVDKDCALLIASDDAGVLGVLRFDRTRSEATISIYLVPDRIGQGLGKHLLIAGERWLQTHWSDVSRLKANVRVDNLRSAKLFETAGYQATSQHFIKRLGG